MNGTLPPTRVYAGLRAAASQEMLADVVRRSAAPGARRRKTAAWVAGVGVSGAVVAGAAVAKEVFGSAPDRSLARCHTTTDLGRGGDFAGASVAAADAHGVVTIDRAIDACANVWSQGMLTVGSNQLSEPNPAASAPVPPLVGCVDSDGVAAIFPGGKGLCTSLGLPALVEVP